MRCSFLIRNRSRNKLAKFDYVSLLPKKQIVKLPRIKNDSNAYILIGIRKINESVDTLCSLTPE